MESRLICYVGKDLVPDLSEDCTLLSVRKTIDLKSLTNTANTHEYLNINVHMRTVISHEHVGGLENFYTRNA